MVYEEEPERMDADINGQPHSMVYGKMEQIMNNMQNADSGVPVKTAKNFSTTIPGAFTGCDFVGWVAEYLQTDDRAEALHLGSFFCHLGYIYPVFDMKTSLKDDSTLYRFQTPYFWPSLNLRPDYVEYAIYLTKRSLRNKQKHGLDEHEQMALAKLQKMLCDKWDFIYMQAQEQVRLLKERKKADKLVITSQERAFWKVQSTLPNQINHTDVAKRNCRQETSQRKSFEYLRKQVQFLQLCLKMPRMKTSKVFECLAHRCDLYKEHDPFLVAPFPSNPWITDETSMWSFDAGLTDTPMERRMKKWSFGLDELLYDPTGLREFQLFLDKEFSSENVKFWLAVEQLKHLPLSKVEAKAKEIYDEFLAQGAPSEINIDSRTMSETSKRLQKPTRLMYDLAQDHIYLLMKKDSYPRFLRSEQYKGLLTFAYNPSTRKKLFNFGSKKQSKDLSPKIKRRGSTSRVVNHVEVDDLLCTNTLSQHSYSTGNLIDIESYRSGKSTPYGSSGSIVDEQNQSVKRFSPVSIRKKLEDFFLSPATSPHRTKLEVPPHHIVNHSTMQPDSAMLSVNISVPSGAKNVIAPWENNTDSSLDSSCNVNIVQTVMD